MIRLWSALRIRGKLIGDNGDGSEVAKSRSELVT